MQWKEKRITLKYNYLVFFEKLNEFFDQLTLSLLITSPDGNTWWKDKYKNYKKYINCQWMSSIEKVSMQNAIDIKIESN